MKRTILILLIITISTFLYSCGLFRSKKSSLFINEVKQKNDITVQKEQKDSTLQYTVGTSENTNKVLSEEITVKNSIPSIPVELTAKFRVDTARSLNGDTALTLVDINDSNISVSIYQNRRTNELTAKVKTKNGTKNIPFSEMQIKRNYRENSSKSDTSKYLNKVTIAKIDSVNKSVSEVFIKQKYRQSEPASKSVWVVFGIFLLSIGIGYLIYKKYKI